MPILGKYSSNSLIHDFLSAPPKGVARVSGKVGHESNEGGQGMNEVTQTCNATCCS